MLVGSKSVCWDVPSTSSEVNPTPPWLSWQPVWVYIEPLCTAIFLRATRLSDVWLSELPPRADTWSPRLRQIPRSCAS